jgi:prolyl-tRNA editing enzyme YbaK/EbsC (Cys-tRNA(Pro) deacylase)
MPPGKKKASRITLGQKGGKRHADQARHKMHQRSSKVSSNRGIPFSVRLDRVLEKHGALPVVVSGIGGAKGGAVLHLVKALNRHLPHTVKPSQVLKVVVYLVEDLTLGDKSRWHTAIVAVPGNKKVDVNALRASYGAKSIRLASPEHAALVTGAMPGFIPPIPIGRVAGNRVHVFIDQAVAEDGDAFYVARDNVSQYLLNSANILRLLKKLKIRHEVIPISK